MVYILVREEGERRVAGIAEIRKWRLVRGTGARCVERMKW